MIKKYIDEKIYFLMCMFLILITTIIWGYIKYRIIYLPNVPFWDYSAHIKLSKYMFEQQQIPTAYFLYQMMTSVFHFLFNVSFKFAGFMTDFLSYIAVALILYYYYCLKVIKNNKSYLVVMLFVVLTFFIIPIPFNGIDFSSDPRKLYTSFYTGYLHYSNVYHNPTLSILKPFSLLLYILAIKYIYNSYNNHIIVFLTIALSALAKPSFVLVILPAIFIYGIVDKIFFKEVNIKRVFVLCLVITGVLIFQYFATYLGIVELSNKREIVLKIVPFAFVDVLWKNSNTMLFSLLGSFLFLFTVLISFWREILQNKDTRFALIIGLVGLSIPFLFAEYLNNKLYTAGNFFWSMQIGLYITNVLFVKFLLDKLLKWKVLSLVNKIKVVILSLILSLHILSGIAWYFAVLNYG